MHSNKGILFVLVSTFLFATYGVWSRLIGDSFGIFYQSWSRALVITLLLFPYLLWKKRIIPISRKDFGWFGIFLFFTSLTQAPIFYAFNHMDIGTATLLFFVSMLLMMYCTGLLFLGETLTKIKIVCFILAGIGLYIMFSFSLALFSLLAAGLAIVNGIVSGGEISFSKKLSQKYSVLYLSWWSWVIIVLTNAPLSFLLGEVQHLPSFEIVWLYELGYILASIFGFWFILEGVKYTEASIAGLLGLLEVVFSILLGILLFKEELALKIVIGALFIIVAAALPHVVDLWSESKHSS